MERRKVKFLILGATGMAGHTVSLYLYEQGHDVTTFSRSNFPYCKNINGNALDKQFMTTMLQREEYDVVINCLGVLNQECDMEPSKAVYLNSFLPHFIADTLKNTGTRLFHMSTDCVFSGKSGNYNEKSFHDGETFYDRTKSLGEIDDNRNLTLRNSIVGPDMAENGIGLFNWFMRQNGTIKGYNKAIWTGVTTLTLAKAMEQASFEKLTGVYNLVNNKSISKFDLLNLFNKQMRNDSVTILQSEEVDLNKSLVNTRKDFSFEVPSYEVMVIKMKEWIYNHQNLYPHYFRYK